MKYGLLTRSLKLEDPRLNDEIAGAIEGIGLLVASLLAATGVLLFFGIAADGRMTGTVRALREFHEFWGPVMWGYLAVHAGAAMLHLALGHRSVFGVFGLPDNRQG